MQRISRKTLYELVWSKPLKAIQQDFGLSYHRLKALCKENKIPLPENGFWTKKAFGKDFIIKPLLDYPNIPYEIVLTEKNQNNLPPDKVLNGNNEKILVPTLIKDWHPLVARFRDKYIVYQNEIKTKNWSHALNGELGIRVKESHFARATRIFDTVIKALEIKGHKVFINDSGTHITIGEQTYQLSIRTKHKRVIDDARTSTYQYTKLIPQDILIFKILKIYSFEFADTPNKNLEDKVNAIIKRIELMAIKDTKIMEDARKQNQIYQAQRIQREAVIKAQQLERSKFDTLIRDAEDWNKAVLVSKYLDEIEKKPTLTQDELEYISWGRKRAEILNPLKRTSFNINS